MQGILAAAGVALAMLFIVYLKPVRNARSPTSFDSEYDVHSPRALSALEPFSFSKTERVHRNKRKVVSPVRKRFTPWPSHRADHQAYDPSVGRRRQAVQGLWTDWQAAPGPLKEHVNMNPAVSYARDEQRAYCSRHKYREDDDLEGSEEWLLNADEAFNYLYCLRCTTAWAGSECPPGDLLDHSPPPEGFTFLLPEKYHDLTRKHGVNEPQQLPAAKALLRHVMANGCAAWRRGVFLNCTRLRTLPEQKGLAHHFPDSRFMLSALPPLPPSHPVSGTGRPLCDARDIHNLSDGFVDRATNLWVPRHCRLPYRFPHELLHKCLKGKRFFFVGDSPLRQMYGRLISFIRQQPLFVEHDFSTFSSYAYDGERDEWRVHNQDIDRQTTTTTTTTSEDASDGPSSDAVNVNITHGFRLGVDLPDDDSNAFYMGRFSDPRLRYWPQLELILDAFQPTHLIVGSNYWWDDGELEEAPERIIHNLITAVRKRGKGTSALGTVLWYSFPCHPTGSDGEKAYARRDEANVAVIRSLQRGWRSHSGPGEDLEDIRLGFLPTCAVAQAGLSSFSVDTVHLACRFHPFPALGTAEAEPVHQLKATTDFDCSDGVDFTNIRVLLTSACPEQL